MADDADDKELTDQQARGQVNQDLGYAKPGPYQTDLGEDEPKFQEWMKAGNSPVPFDQTWPPDQSQQDYDLRGYYKALMAGDPRAESSLDPNDNKIHVGDTFKTPYHATFSNLSQYATENAPHWEGDQLVSSEGIPIYDDTAQRPAPSANDSMVKARLEGYSWPEIQGHIADSTDTALAAGYTKSEIDAHLGYDGANTLGTTLAQSRPAEIPPPSETPAPLDQTVKDTYAAALQAGTARNHSDYTDMLGETWNLDPLTQQQIKAQLPNPETLIDQGIELAHLTGTDLFEGAKAVKDNLLNLWTNTPEGSWNEQAARKQYLSDPLLADAMTKPGGIASAKDAQNQEEAEKLQPTLQDLTQQAGRDALRHAAIPLPYLWADPETIVDTAKSIYNLPADALSYWDKVEQDRVAGKDVSEAWKDSPGVNLVAQALLLKGAHTGGELLKEAAGATPGTIKDVTGARVPGEPIAPKPGEEAKPPKGTEPAPPFDLHPEHVPPEVLDTMRTPDGTLDANKIAMAMGEQVKGEKAEPKAEQPEEAGAGNVPMHDDLLEAPRDIHRSYNALPEEDQRRVNEIQEKLGRKNVMVDSPEEKLLNEQDALFEKGGKLFQKRANAALEPAEAPSEPKAGPIKPEDLDVSSSTTMQIHDPEEGHIGHIKTRVEGNVVTILHSYVDDHMQGQGIGGAAYRQVIDKALAEGKTVRSDAEVSVAAERVYRSLERRGYEVTEIGGKEFPQFAVTKGPEAPKIEVNGQTITREPKESDEDFALRAHAEHTKGEVDGAVSELANPKPVEAPPPVLKPPGLEDEDTNVTSWVKDLDRQILQLSSNARAGEAASFRMFKAEPKAWLDPAFQSKVRKSVELKLGADDPDSVIHPPDVQAFLDAHKSLTDHQYANAVEQAKLLGVKKELRTVDQGHVHRILKGEENLGHELDPETNRDPITGVRPTTRAMSKWDPGMQSRADMYVLEDKAGNRVWGKDKLADLSPDKDNPVKVGDTIDFGGQKVEGGKEGEWKIKPARQDEIEANTPLRYRDNFLGQTVQSVMQSDRVNDNLRFIRANVPRLQEAGLFVPESEAGGKIPSGWVRVDVPQMRGYAPPRIARPLNNFYQLAWERGDLLPALVTANHWIISSLFMSPVVHLKNEGAHFIPSRGWQWVNPMGYARLLYYGNKAMKETYGMGHDYERYVLANGALLGSATRTRNFTQMMWTRFLGEQMEDAGGAWSGVAKYSGFKTLKAMVAWQYNNSGKILWNGGDILRLTRMLELENADKIGVMGGRQRSVAEAVRETHKSMPSYQIGSEVLGSGKMAEVMKSPLFQIFGRYRHGQIGALYNDIRDVSGPARSPMERFEAAGRIVAFTGMYSAMAAAGVYAGGATLVHAAQSLYSGGKEWQNVLSSWFTSAPIIRALEMITSNLDHNGKEIWRKGGTTFGNLVNTARAGISQFPIGQNALELTSPGGPAKVALKYLGWDQSKPVDPVAKAKWDKRDAAAAAAAERKDSLETFLRNFANENLGTNIQGPPAGGGGGVGGGGRSSAQSREAAGYDPGGIIVRGGGQRASEGSPVDQGGIVAEDQSGQQQNGIVARGGRVIARGRAAYRGRARRR